MFGLFRFGLAVMVVFGHMLPLRMGGWNWFGPYAVWSFFTLSGYLMTLVLHERYGFTGGGLLRFFVNRSLRIYPPYWAALLLTIILVVAAPFWVAPVSGTVGLPRVLGDWPRHLLLFGLHAVVTPQLLPPAWSLHVEMCFYVMMGVLLSRSRAIVSLWLVLSVLWTAWAVEHELQIADRYNTLLAASLPFSLGAAVYCLVGRRRVPGWTLAPALLLYGVNMVFARPGWTDPYREPFYLNAVLGAFVVAGLAGVQPSESRPWFAKLDRTAGDISYPVFLLHLPVAWIVNGTLMTVTPTNRWSLLMLCLCLVIPASWTLHRLLEVPIERVRKHVVRGSGRTGADRVQMRLW